MKTKKQIQARIDKLDKKLSLIVKHHDKYVKLYHKACDSWSCKDLTGSRIRRYKSKYIELYEIWRETTHYKKGLEWVLNEQKISEVEDER